MTDADPGLIAARARLEALFMAFDRLTPDELAHVGFRMADDEERDGLLDAVDEAALRTGRVALVDEARLLARDAVMRRFSDGTYHPTFVGLNWGLSQGTVEDRVSIAETLADAAAAAVVDDALDPSVAEALALEAGAITGLATGIASEGSLERVVHRSDDPELGLPRPARIALLVVAALMAGLVLLGFLVEGAVLVLVAVAVIALVEAVRRQGRPG